ncbi:MAG: class I SAM-dependent methyltransferase [Actinomycetota bacterium]|nr:class I SAM-dependent methyltransferase [Actinomycetota bacterium]
MNEPHKGTVESGYDQMAEQYLATRDPEDPLALRALADLASLLPKEAAVLDLGCGAGVPVTRWLADRGFAVTGVDVSAKQLELARTYVPEGTFIKADMTEVDFGLESFDAVVAFHSIIHVPRTEHPALVKSIHRWLRTGGALLATMAVVDYEGRDEDWEGWGAPMVWSHYDRNANVAMLRDAGFEIRYAEPRTGGGTGDETETWLWVLASKKTREGTT